METSPSFQHDHLKSVESALDRIDELMSAYLDDALTDETVDELNDLLSEDATARERCLSAATLHADLIALFQEEQQTGILMAE